MPLAERQRFQASNLARRVRLPQGTLFIAGCLLVDRRGFEPRRRGFDSCTRNFDDGTIRKPMRDRSMAGRGALNAVMLVQAQLPQLINNGSQPAG